MALRDPLLLIYADISLRPRAGELAHRWGLELQAQPPQIGYYLSLDEHCLALKQAGPRAPGPVYVDFVGGAVGHRHQFGGGRGQAIAKAVGLKGGNNPSVLDATAGLGRDAFVLASLGCTVTMIERSAIVAALLQDGMQRALEEPRTAEIVRERMTLLPVDACSYMDNLPESERFDVVYLDPMFPEREKSAKVKKGMASFHTLLGTDPDADRLLPVALKVARQRVVVKRPARAEPLNQQKPSMTIKTKKNRFDVYVIKALEG